MNQRRKQPGDWLWRKALLKVICATAFLVAGASSLLTACVVLLIAQADLVAYLILIPAGAISVVGVILMQTGWRPENMLKGANTEAQIGSAIESALTRQGCAVAHHVVGFGSGDIDHLVATPTRLWVIESKSSRIPKQHFNRTGKYGDCLTSTIVLRGRQLTACR